MGAIVDAITSSWKRIWTGLALAAAASVSASAASQVPAPSAVPAKAAAATSIPPAPIYISSRVAELGRAFDGQVGIAITSIDDGWSTGWKTDELYPQQSVSKLWVAITAMDAVDNGKVPLDDPVSLIE